MSHALPETHVLAVFFHGLKIKVVSAEQGLSDHLRRHFATCLAAPQGPCDLTIDVAWVRGAGKGLGGLIADGWRRIATNTFLKDNACVFLHKFEKRKTRMDFFLEGRSLRFVARRERKFQDPFRRDAENERTELCYHFVYFPALWYLQHFFGVHVLHAGAVRSGGKTIVYMGLDSMGKTTLSLCLGQADPASFVSDNLLLHDGEKVFACYEPVKVRDADAGSVPEAFQKITRTRLRHHYAPPARQDAGLSPDVFVLPAFSKEPFLRRISCEQACRAAMNTNLLASEIKKYRELADLWNLATASETLATAQEKILLRLLSRAACYSLGIGSAETPQQTVQRLRDLAAQGHA